MRHSLSLGSLGAFASLLFAASLAGAAPVPLAVSGRVLDDQGAALAGAEVALAPVPEPLERARLELAGRAAPEPVARARSGADGSYRLEAPKAGLYQVLVSGRDRVPMRFSPLAVVDEVELEPVRLARDAGGSVQVVDSTGVPLAGIRVSAAADPPSRWSWGGPPKWGIAPQWGVTDAEGRVTYARGAQSDYRIAALSAERPASVLEGLREKSTRLTLADGVARQIEIRSGAKPAAGAAIWLDQPRLALAIADEAGLASVHLPGKGALQVVASDALRASVRARVRPLRGEEPERPQRLTLEPARPIAGRVLDAETLAPIVGAIVYDRGGESGWAISDARGYALAVEREADLPWLAGAAPGYLPEAPLAAVDLAARQGPTIALEPAASIEGVVVDASGAPVAGAEVAARPQRRVGAGFFGGGEPESMRAESDARGAFRLRRLAASSDWEVSARKSGYGVARERIDSLAAGRRRTGVRLVLPPPGQLVGRILAGDESPIAGARLELAPSAGDVRLRLLQPRTPRSERPKATSGADGAFAFGSLGAGRFDLAVEAAGCAPTKIPQIEIVAGEAVDLGEIVLDPGVEVEGRVVDGRGAPVAGVEILLDARAVFSGFEVPDPVAVSGEDGRFVVRDRRPGERIDLVARKAGYGTASQGGIVVPPERPVRLELPALGRISGRVLDARDRPARATVGAVVVFRMQSGTGGAMMGSREVGPVATDDDGRFELADVPPGQVSVMASGEGGERAQTEDLELAPGGTLEGIEIRLTGGARLVGRVLDPAGRPARDALIDLEGSAPKPIAASSTPTDGDGRFWVDGVPAGRYTVIASKFPYRRAAREIEVGAADSEVAVELLLEAGLAVRGTVVDDQGAPALEALVALGLVGSGRGQRPTALSRADGSFEIEGVEPGTYRITAEKAGFRRAELAEPLVVEGFDVDGVQLRLARGGAIFGHVTGLAFDDLAETRIAARMQEQFTGTGPDYEGGYRLEGLAPGEWTLVAELARSGRRAQGRATLADPPGEVEVDLEFGKGLVLTGQVLWRGEPVAGAWVSASGGGAPMPATGQTGADGRFRIEGLAEGSYQVRATESSGRAWALEQVELAADREIRLELASATIEGSVRDARDDRPISGADVRVEPASGESAAGMRVWIGSDATGDDGRYRREGIGLGEQRVLASAEGYAAAEQRVTIVDRDQVARVDFRLEPNEGITVTVLGPNGLPPERVWVAALDAGGAAVWSDFPAPGEGGRLRLTSLPPGEWTLLAGGRDLPVVKRRVTSPGEAGEIRIPPPGLLRVRVPALAEGALSTLRLIGADGEPYVHPYGMAAQADYRMSGREIAIGSLPPGPWRVEVTSADGRVFAGAVTVEANREVAVEIE